MWGIETFVSQGPGEGNPAGTKLLAAFHGSSHDKNLLHAYYVSLPFVSKRTRWVSSIDTFSRQSIQRSMSVNTHFAGERAPQRITYGSPRYSSVETK